ncbi:MAG: hypothetical protein IJQ01_06480, partial [Selenomonadaceae bacterium]|nr:hypothetical protein [Selenomonadaceae bacterium]
IEKYKNATVESVDDLIKREQPRAFNVIKDNPLLYQQVKSIYEPIFEALKDVQDEIKRKNEELKKELEKQLTSVADISSAASDRLKVEQNPELLKEAESVKKILQEASNIQYKLSHTDYENKKLDILQWQQDMLNQAEITEKKRIAIEKLGGAKLAQLEQEHAEEIAKAHEEATAKIQAHWNNAAYIEFSLTHSAFEKQIRDIEQWEQAQREKADTAEEIAGIIAESAAKEAQAFEREMDRIKGKLQSLDDKIFEIDHSQYENDLHRIQQDYLKQVGEYQAMGMFTPEVQAKLDYLFNRQKQNLDARAKDGGDYTKAPEGAMRRGGNGISIIEGDQIVDDGLKRMEIGLLTNENQIRQQLLPNLSREAQEKLAAIQATRALTDAQKELAQATTQSGYQIIEGDEVVNNPSGYQVIEGDEVVSGLQEFNSAVQGTTATLEQMNQPMSEFETLSATMAQAESEFQESLKRMAESLPVNYFKTLADNAKAVSDMQFGLTESTMKLIDAQEQLREALKNLPKIDSVVPTSNQQSTNGLMNLSTQRQVSDIPQQPVQQDSGMKFGFDWDVFGGLAGLAALIPHPAAKVLALGGALGAGAGVGTFNETTAQSTPMTFETIVTPLNNIHTVVSNILSEMGNQQAQPITVSPNISVNLGGAYVFDNAMKSELTNDITQNIVDEIAMTVERATRRADYSYGA